MFDAASDSAEAAEEALEEVAAAVVAPAVAPAAAGQIEQLIFKASALKVTVEQVVGVRNVPLVLLDSALEAQVKDWSSKVGTCWVCAPSGMTGLAACGYYLRVFLFHIFS